MRNFGRIAFVVALAACGDGAPLTPCEMNPSMAGCVCELNPMAPGCAGAQCNEDVDCAALNNGTCIKGDCDNHVCIAVDTCQLGDPIGDGRMFFNENGNAFFGFAVDETGVLTAFMDAEQDFYSSIPDGTCTTGSIADVEGEPEFTSLGGVELRRGSTVIVSLTPNPQAGYETVFDTDLLQLGESLDVGFEGGGIFAEQTVGDLVRVIEAFPAFDGVTNNTLALTKTITFDAPADHTRLTTSYIDPLGNAITLTCIAKDGTFTFDDATFDGLPQQGSISLTAWNETFVPVETTDDSAKSFRGQVIATKNVQYAK
jgi:hypothetical protein